MARGKTVIGICRICGIEGKLSFEHVPPRAAFNDSKFLKMDFESAINYVPGNKASVREQQKGVGDYTLCESCNNNTGAWYAARFVDFCYRGMQIMLQTGWKSSELAFIYPLFPLAVIKQIVTMFLACGHEKWIDTVPELAHFVLNKEERYLSPKFRFFIYYNISPLNRVTGLTGQLTPDKGHRLMSEITFRPFGYVMTLDGASPPDNRLVDISFFANYRYQDFKVFNIWLPLLEINTAFPGDYRTQEQLLLDIKTNEIAAAKVKSE